MKNKILIFIIGILIGAIITTSAFLVYNKILQKNQKQIEIEQINENRPNEPSSYKNMGEPPLIPNQNGGKRTKTPSSSSNNI